MYTLNTFEFRRNNGNWVLWHYTVHILMYQSILFLTLLIACFMKNCSCEMWSTIQFPSQCGLWSLYSSINSISFLTYLRQASSFSWTKLDVASSPQLAAAPTLDVASSPQLAWAPMPPAAAPTPEPAPGVQPQGYPA